MDATALQFLFTHSLRSCMPGLDAPCDAQPFVLWRDFSAIILKPSETWLSQGMSGAHSFGDKGPNPCQTAGHLARFAEGQARQAFCSASYCVAPESLLLLCKLTPIQSCLRHKFCSLQGSAQPDFLGSPIVCVCIT